MYVRINRPFYDGECTCNPPKDALVKRPYWYTLPGALVERDLLQERSRRQCLMDLRLNDEKLLLRRWHAAAPDDALVRLLDRLAQDPGYLRKEREYDWYLANELVHSLPRSSGGLERTYKRVFIKGKPMPYGLKDFEYRRLLFWSVTGEDLAAAILADPNTDAMIDPFWHLSPSITGRAVTISIQ